MYKRQSDDSYIYQLSLVLATATVSFARVFAVEQIMLGCIGLENIRYYFEVYHFTVISKPGVSQTEIIVVSQHLDIQSSMKHVISELDLESPGHQTQPENMLPCNMTWNCNKPEDTVAVAKTSDS